MSAVDLLAGGEPRRLAHDVQAPTRALLRAIRTFGQVMCGWRGHSAMLHFEPGHLCLRCAWCGHETPGWTIGSPSR